MIYDPCRSRTCGNVALTVLYVPNYHSRSVRPSRPRTAHGAPTVSISITVRKAFSEMFSIGAKKFPAAPTPPSQTVRIQRGARGRSDLPQITKSMRPNLEMVASTAARSCSGFRTSACAGRQVRPVEEDSSRADVVTRSILRTGNQYEYG